MPSGNIFLSFRHSYVNKIDGFDFLNNSVCWDLWVANHKAELPTARDLYKNNNGLIKSDYTGLWYLAYVSGVILSVRAPPSHSSFMSYSPSEVIFLLRHLLWRFYIARYRGLQGAIFKRATYHDHVNNKLIDCFETWKKLWCNKNTCRDISPSFLVHFSLHGTLTFTTHLIHGNCIITKTNGQLPKELSRMYVKGIPHVRGVTASSGWL